MTTAWGSGAWGDNSWGGLQSEISGVAASGAVGTTGVNVTVALTGVGGTGAVGVVTGEVFYFAAITGVEARQYPVDVAMHIVLGDVLLGNLFPSAVQQDLDTLHLVHRSLNPHQDQSGDE